MLRLIVTTSRREVNAPGGYIDEDQDYDVLPPFQLADIVHGYLDGVCSGAWDSVSFTVGRPAREGQDQ